MNTRLFHNGFVPVWIRLVESSVRDTCQFLCTVVQKLVINVCRSLLIQCNFRFSMWVLGSLFCGHGLAAGFIEVLQHFPFLGKESPRLRFCFCWRGGGGVEEQLETKENLRGSFGSKIRKSEDVCQSSNTPSPLVVLNCPEGRNSPSLSGCRTLE